MKIVRNILVLICLLAASAAFGCNTQTVTISEPTPEPTPTPAYTVDEKGNAIKPDGWALPKTTEKEKNLSKRKEKYQDGETAIVTVASYSIEYGEAHRVDFEEPYKQTGMTSVISRVEELSVGTGKVFCYVYWLVPYRDGHAIPTTTKAKLCDMDGDGKYELRGTGFGIVTVPDWAK